jgi:hypothetical protein
MRITSISTAFVLSLGACTFAMAADPPNSSADGARFPGDIDRGMQFDRIEMEKRFNLRGMPRSLDMTEGTMIITASAFGFVPSGEVHDDPKSFESTAAAIDWARKTSAVASPRAELSYKGRKVLVIFRSQMLGGYSSEPFVFVERSGRLVRLVHVEACFFHMEASIRDNWLVLWRMKKPGDKEKTEFLKYNLDALDVAPTSPAAASKADVRATH